MTIESNSKTSRKPFRDRLILLLGITSTMPIVGVPVGGRYITLFTIIFLFYFGLSLVTVFFQRGLTFKVTTFKRTYLLFLLSPLVAYIVGLLYMPNEWHSSMTSYVVRAIEYLLLTIILYASNNKDEAKVFVKGLIIGIAANAVWSVFEAITFYFFRQSLNDMLFSRFLGINRDILLWNRYGGIRVSGFNYDPAHLGGILPILLFYGLTQGNIYLIGLSLVSLAFSQSTTALAGAAVALIVFLFIKKGKGEKKSIHKISGKALFGAFGSVLIIVIILVAFNSNGSLSRFIDSISENIGGYITRINTVYVKSNNIEPREVYYTQFLDGLIERGPIVSITGSGLGTSMYPFRNVSGLFAAGSQNTVTEIETNYIAYLFDLGIVGLTLYIVFLIGGFRRFLKAIKLSNNKTIAVFLGFFISIICCSALYHYIFTAYQMLTFSFATVYADAILDDVTEEIV